MGRLSGWGRGPKNPARCSDTRTGQSEPADTARTSDAAGHPGGQHVVEYRCKSAARTVLAVFRAVMCSLIRHRTVAGSSAATDALRHGQR